MLGTYLEDAIFWIIMYSFILRLIMQKPIKYFIEARNIQGFNQVIIKPGFESLCNILGIALAVTATTGVVKNVASAFNSLSN